MTLWTRLESLSRKGMAAQVVLGGPRSSHHRSRRPRDLRLAIRLRLKPAFASVSCESTGSCSRPRSCCRISTSSSSQGLSKISWKSGNTKFRLGHGTAGILEGRLAKIVSRRDGGITTGGMTDQRRANDLLSSLPRRLLECSELKKTQKPASRIIAITLYTRTSF